MQMTNEEIVREYRLSADHQRQIEILADENLCRKSDIAKILIDAGCDVPKYWRNKFSPAPSTSQAPVKEKPEPPQEAAPACDAELMGKIGKAVDSFLPEHTMRNSSIRDAAVEVIAKLLKNTDILQAADTDAYIYFTEQVRGVFALVYEIEGRGEDVPTGTN